MLRQSIKNYISFGILLFLLAGLVFAVYLVRQRQEIRKKAVTSGSLGSVYLSTPQSTYGLGDIIPVEIKFRTGSSFKSSAQISVITLLIQFPFFGNTPELEVVDPSGNALSIGGSAFYASPELPSFPEGWQTDPDATRWVFPVNKFYTQGKTVKIEIAGADTFIKGTRTPTHLSLGTFYLKVKSVPVGGDITFSFDLLQSKLLTKDSPIQDILDTPQSLTLTIQEVPPEPSLTPILTPTSFPTATITVIPTNTPTATPRVTPSVTPTVTPSVTPTITLTPTVTPTVVPGTTDYTLAGPASVTTQTTFTVTVGINTGSTTVKEAKTTLNYDGSKIWFINVSGGGFFPSSTLQINANSGSGWVNAKLTKGSLPAPSGSGNLVTFTFKAVCAATSAVLLQSGASNNYVYRDITANTNIYNGQTDSINITATGTGQCGTPVTPTPRPSSTPTPTITPSPTPIPPLLRLKAGWNKIVWPSGVSKTANQLPTVCPVAVNKMTIFSDFMKDFWPTDWNFVSGRTYYIKCTSAVPWQL